MREFTCKISFASTLRLFHCQSSKYGAYSTGIRSSGRNDFPDCLEPPKKLLKLCAGRRFVRIHRFVRPSVRWRRQPYSEDSSPVPWKAEVKLPCRATDEGGEKRKSPSVPQPSSSTRFFPALRGPPPSPPPLAPTPEDTRCASFHACN